MDAAGTRAMRVVVGACVVAALVAGFLVVVMFIGRTGASAEAPLYLEATEQPGENPFVPTAAVAPRPAPSAGQPPSPDTPGSGELARCDPARLIAYLTSHRAAAEAWVAALNADATLTWSGGNHVSVEQVPDYIDELTAVSLSSDRRVTNYQFVNGVAVSVQSVLQANTAVLVDRSGVPRVRCACGNPLTPMRQITAPPKYVGTPWSGFTPVVVVVIVDRNPRCDDDEYYDGDRCRPYVECPPPQYLGMDGRCYYHADPCPDGWLRDNDGRCYDPYPERCPSGYVKRPGVDCVDPPICPNGKPRESGKPCAPPEVCPDGSLKTPGSDCASTPVCRGDPAAGSKDCPKPPTCPDGSEQERGKACPPDPRCSATIQQADPDCPAGPRCPDGSPQEQGKECSSGPPCQPGAQQPIGAGCSFVAPPSQQLQPGSCADGSVQPEGGVCPVTVAPPSQEQPKLCPDGSALPEGGACPEVTPSSQPAQPKLCPDGSVQPEGGVCPVTVAPPSQQRQPKLCPDGSVQQEGRTCPVTVPPPKKPQKKQPTVCADGSLPPEGGACPVVPPRNPQGQTCPPGTVPGNGGCVPTAQGRRRTRTGW